MGLGLAGAVDDHEVVGIGATIGELLCNLAHGREVI